MRIISLLLSLALAQPLLAQNNASSDSMLVADLRAKGVTFSHDNSVTLLMTGQTKFDDLFRAIDQAKSSIHMEYFNFRNDSINRELFKHLYPKAKQGVKVRCVFDGFGNKSNNQPMRKEDIRRIREQGIEIYEFNPVKFPWLNDIFFRDHRKIVVIDGQIAYTGGMNVADYYIHGTAQVGSWHDMHCRIEGSEVNTLQKIFLRMWKQVSGEDLTADRSLFRGASAYSAGSKATAVDGHKASYFESLKQDTCSSAGRKMVGIINKEPRLNADIIRYFYLRAIENAQDSIKLISPYFTLNHKIKRALRQAVKRGVKVEIMLSAKNDEPLTPDCGYYIAHKLMKHGINIWIYKPGFHHTKVIMVDGKYCTVGSANLDSRSLRWDRECNAVIIDPCTTEQLVDLFENQKPDSFRLTEEVWRQWRTPWQRFRGWMGRLLAPFL